MNLKNLKKKKTECLCTYIKIIVDEIFEEKKTIWGKNKTDIVYTVVGTCRTVTCSHFTPFHYDVDL